MEQSPKTVIFHFFRTNNRAF